MIERFEFVKWLDEETFLIKKEVFDEVEFIELNLNNILNNIIIEGDKLIFKLKTIEKGTINESV